jgi:membrane associated rhomboid family serine protease
MGGAGWLLLGNGIPMIGASGAIMGIIGIFLVLFPRNDVTVLFYWRSLWHRCGLGVRAVALGALDGLRAKLV